MWIISGDLEKERTVQRADGCLSFPGPQKTWYLLLMLSSAIKPLTMSFWSCAFHMKFNDDKEILIMCFPFGNLSFSTAKKNVCPSFLGSTIFCFKCFSRSGSLHMSLWPNFRSLFDLDMFLRLGTAKSRKTVALCLPMLHWTHKQLPTIMLSCYKKTHICKMLLGCLDCFFRFKQSTNISDGVVLWVPSRD